MIDEEEFISLEEKIDLMNCKSFRARRQFLKKIKVTPQDEAGLTVRVPNDTAIIDFPERKEYTIWEASERIIDLDYDFKIKFRFENCKWINIYDGDGMIYRGESEEYNSLSVYQHRDGNYLLYWNNQPNEKSIMSIREIRQATGLTQAEFAEKFHIPKRSIENWEMGERKCPEYVNYLLQKVIKL